MKTELLKPTNPEGDEDVGIYQGTYSGQTDIHFYRFDFRDSLCHDPPLPMDSFMKG
jgi:hypothetical protein